MMATKLYIGFMNFGYRMKRQYQCQKGMGTVEMILLIMILIGLAALFKNSLKTFYDNLVHNLNGSDAAQGVKFN